MKTLVGGVFFISDEKFITLQLARLSKFLGSPLL
jgi:hypothetical protein